MRIIMVPQNNCTYMKNCVNHHRDGHNLTTEILNVEKPINHHHDGSILITEILDLDNLINHHRDGYDFMNLERGPPCLCRVLITPQENHHQCG